METVNFKSKFKKRKQEGQADQDPETLSGTEDTPSDDDEQEGAELQEEESTPPALEFASIESTATLQGVIKLGFTNMDRALIAFFSNGFVGLAPQDGSSFVLYKDKLSFQKYVSGIGSVIEDTDINPEVVLRFGPLYVLK